MIVTTDNAAGKQLVNTLNRIVDEINKLKYDIAELILLENKQEAVSVYKVSYEEYVELPGNIRL